MGVKEDINLATKYQRKSALLNEANALLSWDQETYMPPKGIKARSEQGALLSKLSHKIMISDKLFAVLERLKKTELKDRDKRMVDKLHRDLLKTRKIPVSFVEEFSRATTLAYQAWAEARKKKQFPIFSPHLEKIINLLQQKIDYLKLPGHRYNSLLDDYEEGMTVEKLKPVFNSLKMKLIKLLEQIEGSKIYQKRKQKNITDKFSEQKIRELITDVTQRMGLNAEFSRLDVSPHPFTIKIGVNDVRITTRFDENLLFSFMGAIHEAGHALYESGLPEEEAYTVLGDAPSLGLHESQSRLWENVVGRGKQFWTFYYPRFKKAFGLKEGMDDWYHKINNVKAGLIRVDSDEVHYCLHAILRFELELALIEGKLNVKELPDAWNEMMDKIMGIKPKNDGEGVLQDIHWSHGSFGYFPTYAIGNMYAAQLYKKAVMVHPGMEKEIAKGNFMTLREWLKRNVHQIGSRYLADEIVKKACGNGLDPNVYMSYLKEKYGELYGF